VARDVVAVGVGDEGALGPPVRVEEERAPGDLELASRELDGQAPHAPAFYIAGPTAA
jgi:hypothetical protein